MHDRISLRKWQSIEDFLDRPFQDFETDIVAFDLAAVSHDDATSDLLDNPYICVVRFIVRTSHRRREESSLMLLEMQGSFFLGPADLEGVVLPLAIVNREGCIASQEKIFADRV